MKLNIISAIIGIMVAGAATATLAKPGDQYTLTAGGCLKGDTVNPPGSAWHCTETMSVKPIGSGIVRPIPVSKDKLSLMKTKKSCETGGGFWDGGTGQGGCTGPRGSQK